MFEARLLEGKVFKQIIEAIKDLVQDANIDCSEQELTIQSMDSSHVSLVAVALQSSGFELFRCDRSISLGFNSANMAKILKCAGGDDIITLKADDDGDTLTLMFESPGNERIADFGTYLLGYCLSVIAIVLAHASFSYTHTSLLSPLQHRTQVDGH
jgi:proliferating cell nuclear antigen